MVGGLGLGGLVLYGIVLTPLAAPAPVQPGYGGTLPLAERLYTTYLLPFELTSLLLLVAIVGAVVVGKRKSLTVGDAPISWYLALSAVLFAIGTVGVLTRRNLIVIFMAIELLLNAVNLSFVALARSLGSVDGQVIVFFVMAVAAAEAAVGLAIMLQLYRLRETLNADEVTTLRW